MSVPANTIDVRDVWVTPHALERLGEHYPDLDHYGAREQLQRALELEAAAVTPILGRRTIDMGSRYFLPVARQGLLVVGHEERMSERRRPYVLITYLRLERSQIDIVNRLWPTTKPVAA